ncbi:hypothetical protein E1B28_009867 [Marasmius oreades]|uniref:Formamidopyrimidine-DNA glycosylase catalytic domain-containing protein n=1 Tax=Marasmius oreades TaxID=181124 RepID=A0A9P7UQJ7_9AGAR|nr:uncharacterized protein E1B28_009867 [Marasmius oreades]KAG7090782.1 hypothetical protein E1B28_009867 [Marasmius oreades]
MPELPEVQRAVKLIRRVALGKRVLQVDVAEDNLVFSGSSSEAFAAEITGRTITSVDRYGKVFYVILDGEGKMPVLHFGMTGMLQVKGEQPMHYKEAPQKVSTIWPPRFMKFNLHLEENTGDITQLAFLDARRLGRIRLRASPTTEPPISELGFDPILSMPALDEFSSLALKRSCPIKALLLDQSFSAGVGNWVADEVLYHSRVHPEQRSNTLSPEQLQSIHQELPNICRTAIAVDADASKFPENWLFNHRWGKGKKAHGLKLPNGDPASIKWITVGGRTSAYVSELQTRRHDHAEKEERESDQTSLGEDHHSQEEPNTGRHRRRTISATDGSCPKKAKTRSGNKAK